MYLKLDELLNRVIVKNVVSVEDYNEAIKLMPNLADVLNSGRFTTEDSTSGFKEFCNTIMQHIDRKLEL